MPPGSSQVVPAPNKRDALPHHGEEEQKRSDIKVQGVMESQSALLEVVCNSRARRAEIDFNASAKLRAEREIG